jgi:hypothetical protein
MGVAETISRAAVDFPFNNVHRAALALGSSMGPKLAPRTEALEEKAPGGGKEAGKAEGVGNKARGEQQRPAHGQHHAF